MLKTLICVTRPQCVKSDMNSTENASCSGQPSTNKKTTLQIEWRNIFTKREDSLSMKLIAVVNFIWMSSEHFDRQSGCV